MITNSQTGVVSLSEPVIVVVGPTASGKSELAQRIALALDGEVISADSMQIYKGLDIGTGKMLPAQRLVPHHGLDIVDPGEPFSAALFQSYARDLFQSMDRAGKRSVLCGGTGFYVRAAIDAYDFPEGEQVGNPIRDHWNAFAQEHGAHDLWCALKKRDPASAALIPENDIKRVVRAFELLSDGVSYAQQKEALSSIEQVVPAIFIGLSVEPSILRERIDCRIESMIEQGLVDEVRSLCGCGLEGALCASQAIGYREIISFLTNEMSLDEAIEAMKVATHRYAKRQRTWFRKDERIHWLDANVPDSEALCKQALSIIATIEREERG